MTLNPEQRSLNSQVPDLPYICTDLSCECRVPSPYPQERVSFEGPFEPNYFRAMVRDEDGRTIDVFVDWNLSSLVEAVHRNYPHARKARP